MHWWDATMRSNNATQMQRWEATTQHRCNDEMQQRNTDATMRCNNAAFYSCVISALDYQKPWVKFPFHALGFSSVKGSVFGPNNLHAMYIHFYFYFLLLLYFYFTFTFTFTFTCNVHPLLGLLGQGNHQTNNKVLTVYDRFFGDFLPKIPYMHCIYVLSTIQTYHRSWLN
jgi:hypothetical protein